MRNNPNFREALGRVELLRPFNSHAYLRVLFKELLEAAGV
jgi:hypothetical protein